MANFLHFRSSSNFLNYIQVVSAIPKHLDKAIEIQVDNGTFLAENEFQLSPNTAKNVHKMKNSLLLASHKQRRYVEIKNKGTPKMGTRPTSGRS